MSTTPNKRPHILSSSTGYSIRLTDAEYAEWQRDEAALYARYYGRERAACGIWATNQGRYVESRYEMGEWDSWVMENLWELWEVRR